MKTEVWAHRGASGYAPENTLEAFELAVKMEADGIELDVQLTKDGEMVVIHDETTDRVSGVKGWVKDFTLEELKGLNVNQTHPEYARVQIPTLREVYELIRPTKLKINVELKTGVVFYSGLERKVLELTDEFGMQERIWYSSFNHYTVRRIKELSPQTKCGVLYEDGIFDVVEYTKKLGADAIHPAVYNLQYDGVVEACRENDIRIHTWTANEKEEIRAMAELGVDAVITNYPDLAKRIIESRV